MFARTAGTGKLKIPWRNEEIKCNASCARFKRNERVEKERGKNVRRERIKTPRERKEKNSRTWRESGTTAEAFRHSRNFQRICRRARSSVSSPVTSLSLSSYSPSPFSISRGISFKVKKARGREEGGCDGFRCADTSSPRRTFLPSSSHNSSILREGEVRKNTEKLFEGRSSSLKSRIYV